MLLHKDPVCVILYYSWLEFLLVYGQYGVLGKHSAVVLGTMLHLT